MFLSSMSLSSEINLVASREPVREMSSDLTASLISLVRSIRVLYSTEFSPIITGSCYMIEHKINQAMNAGSIAWGGGGGYRETSQIYTRLSFYYS